MTKDILIGEIKEFSSMFGNNTHPIYSWKGYGVVCRELGTLNGNIHAVAEHMIEYVLYTPMLREEVKDNSYRVEVILDGAVYPIFDKSQLAELKEYLINLHLRAQGELK